MMAMVVFSSQSPYNGTVCHHNNMSLRQADGTLVTVWLLLSLRSSVLATRVWTMYEKRLLP